MKPWPLMKTLSSLLIGALLAALVATPAHAFAQEAKDEQKGEQKADKETEFTLKNLFPDKGLFGPSARSMAFSHDGRYAAWLYRPYLERRHGSDLWIQDTSSGEVQRVTSVSVLAPFQKSTREVKKDRIKKAAKKKGKDEDEDENDNKDGKEEKKPEMTGDEVGEKDAEDEDAPRYSGVSSFKWSPTADEMMFQSSGDTYHLVMGQEGFQRLTKTRSREGNVQYLPDGSGFTYQQDEAVMRVRFGTHFLEQINPDLPDGMRVQDYEISPDGKSVALLGSTSRRGREGGRTVNIATYGDRFMQVREVPRTVSDDPVGDSTSSVFLYRLPDPDLENGELVKVYTHKRSGPRDSLRVPSWAPDSSKVAFSVFEQSSGHVNILEATFPPEKEEEEGDDQDNGDEDDGASDDQEDGDEDEEAEDDQDEETDKDEMQEHAAKVVYRFLHNGGPTTPNMIQPQYLADSRRMIFLTEQSGFRHLHVLDPVYEAMQQFTHGHFEVYPLDMPEHRKFMFVTATKEDPSTLDVYRLDLEDATMTRLTTEMGSYSSAAVSPDGSKVLALFSNYGNLRELVSIEVTDKEQKKLTDSHPDKARHFTQAKPEALRYQNRHGQEIHGLMWKPEDWKKTDKRPLLIYVYGGPLGTRKQVTQGNFGSDAYFFSRYMTEKYGYVTCTIDPRGMSGYGALFEKANYEQVGVPQVEDLTDGVKFLIENHGVDPERVGIHGWSFGGFQTQMCLYTEPDVFAVGMAGAGPTEWENYNSWYSTGTIGPSREGQTDLKEYSLLPLAKNLKGKLLLVHGMEDSNVLYQDTVRVYSELLEAGKETNVELFLDPSGGHGLGGKVKRLGRYRKYEEFLLRTLGKETE